MSKQLPVLQENISALQKDGTRKKVVPADVHGRFIRWRRVVFYVLIAFYAVLPWVKIHGHPAILLDIQHRQFFLFGWSFNSQDTWLLFFLATALGFSLITVTAFLGRIWCGWACPQTVFLEGLFRPLERLIEGNRNDRLKLSKAPWSLSKVLKRVALQSGYLIFSILVAHIFLSYFVSLSEVFSMVRQSPSEHPTAFLWAVGVTAVMYGNFSWFREQTCVGVCPYGRLQSVLIDTDSLVIGYDTSRGEPRGKLKKTNDEQPKGDCVDCDRCVVVCPTGIDIRNGLQLDCIACAQCIDACDEVMAKVGRPKGLVRYDSLNGLSKKPKRVLRPRVYLYAVLGLIGIIVASFAFEKHTNFEANVLRLRGMPYSLDGGVVRNQFEVHLINKQSEPRSFRLRFEQDAQHREAEYTLPMSEVTIPALGSVDVPFFVSVPREHWSGDFQGNLLVQALGQTPEEKRLQVPVLGPSPSVH